MKLCHLFIILSLLLVTAVAHSADQTVKLTWDRSPEPDAISYQMHRSLISGGPYEAIGAPVLQVPVGSMPEYQDVITDAVEGEYFYVVTATDGRNPSDYSNEIGTNIDTIAPAAPGVLRIEIEGSVNLTINGPVTIKGL